MATLAGKDDPRRPRMLPRNGTEHRKVESSHPFPILGDL